MRPMQTRLTSATRDVSTSEAAGAEAEESEAEAEATSVVDQFASDQFFSCDLQVDTIERNLVSTVCWCTGEYARS